MTKTIKPSDYMGLVQTSASKKEAYHAVKYGLPHWWGRTSNVAEEGERFKVFFGKAFWELEIIKDNADQKIVWKCTDGNPEFEKEWIGTKLIWTFEQDIQGSIIRLLHRGLTPSLNCYGICSSTWDKFLADSLKDFLERGEGKPHY